MAEEGGNLEPRTRITEKTFLPKNPETIPSPTYEVRDSDTGGLVNLILKKKDGAEEKTTTFGQPKTPAESVRHFNLVLEKPTAVGNLLKLKNGDLDVFFEVVARPLAPDNQKTYPNAIWAKKLNLGEFEQLTKSRAVLGIDQLALAEAEKKKIA
jgi:hypothetical protein